MCGSLCAHETARHGGTALTPTTIPAHSQPRDDSPGSSIVQGTLRTFFRDFCKQKRDLFGKHRTKRSRDTDHLDGGGGGASHFLVRLCSFQSAVCWLCGHRLCCWSAEPCVTLNCGGAAPTQHIMSTSYDFSVRWGFRGLLASTAPMSPCMAPLW